MLGAPILGDRENINKVTVNMVKEFHSNFYTSQNISIIAAGGIQHQQFVDLAQKHFSAFSTKPPKPLQKVVDPVYFPSMMAVRDDQRASTDIGVFYDAPCWKHEDYMSFILLERLFGQYIADSTAARITNDAKQVYNSMHSAIRKLGVSKQQAVYSPYREGGLFGNYIKGDNSNSREMLKAALTVPSIYSDYLDDVEVRRAKNKFFFDLLQLECPEDVMMLYSQQMMNVGRIISKPELAKRVSSISSTHLKCICKEWFFNEEPVIVLWGPHADEQGNYETFKSLTREKLSLKNMNWK